MNREEAKEITYEWVGDEWEMLGIVDVEKKIDEIYDDFESKVCINCKFGEPMRANIFCSRMQTTHKSTWYCGDFERKKDE